MSVVTRGRVLRAPRSDAGSAMPIVEPARRQRLAREEVDAHLAKERILESAQERAAAIIARARTEASDAALAAANEAREAEHAKLAAHYIALRAEDERRAERDLDRAIGLAVVLAERLLGQALEANPAHIAALARQALGEAKGARRASIEASALDADALRSHLVTVGLAEGTVEVIVNPDLERGSLRVHTNLGTLDAKLAPQLERLAKTLRDALKSG